MTACTAVLHQEQGVVGQETGAVWGLESSDSLNACPPCPLGLLLGEEKQNRALLCVEATAEPGAETVPTQLLSSQRM